MGAGSLRCTAPLGPMAGQGQTGKAQNEQMISGMPPKRTSDLRVKEYTQYSMSAYGAGELGGLSFSTTSVAMNFNGTGPSFMPT
jgi:hypothetical protein